MKIYSINKCDNNSHTSFKRKPTQNEFKFYTESVKEGLKVLNKELGFIIHNSSVPSGNIENFGIGSLLSTATQDCFVPFLKSHGITSIQQEPNYLRRYSDPSPYDPISTSKNIYMIPLEKLATKEYGFILSENELRPSKTYNDKKVDYKSVNENFYITLATAYMNFLQKMNKNALPSNLVHDYESFKEKHRERLLPDALYDVLSAKNKNEDWQAWPEQDKTLYSNEKNIERRNFLEKTYSESIDFYIFQQWLVEREIKNTNINNKKHDIKIIADTPIAFTPAEVWQNQDLFLEGFALGCPPDYFSSEGQRWGFPVLNPKKIFNQDGSLAKGGEFLKNRYEEIFEASPGGVRIDHLIGLIDPFVYLKTEPHMNESNSGRLYSSPHKELLRDYTKFTENEYSAIFEKIIFPAAEKHGVAKENIICEDLGYVTDNVKKVIEKLGLTGLSLTQFGYSGADAPARNVIMLGAHDNKSYIEFTNELFAKASILGEGRDRFIYKTHILGSDTVNPKEDVHQYREDIRRDKTKFLAASFAELFTSPAKKVQIFFTDFFGMDKTYNVPGAKKDCWTLRLESDYEKLYYSNLQKGLGVNLPEAIARAIRNKGEEFSSNHAGLLRKLDYFTGILKK